MRYLMILLFLVSACTSAKNAKQENSPIKFIDAFSQQSNLGFQNVEGSSSFTSYVITIQKDDDVRINTVYIHGVPFLFEENIYEGKTLITIQVNENFDKHIDKAKSKIESETDGVIEYVYNNKISLLVFSIAEKSAIQNK